MIEASLIKEAIPIVLLIEQRSLRHHISELLWCTQSFVAQKRWNFDDLVLCHFFNQRSLLDQILLLRVYSRLTWAVLSEDFFGKAFFFSIVELVVIWAWRVEVGLFVCHCVDHGIWLDLIILFLKCFLMQSWLLFYILFITALTCNKTWYFFLIAAILLRLSRIEVMHR